MMINFQDNDDSKYEFHLEKFSCRIARYDSDGLGCGCTISNQVLLSRGHWLLSTAAENFIKKIIKNKAFI